LTTDKTKDSDELLIKPLRVAQLLACSKPYVYKMAKAGLLPVVEWELNGSKTLRFHRDDILDFIEKHRS
jgi:excisionase family DNA binding protein